MISDTNKTMLNIVSAIIHNQSVEGIEVLNWEPFYEELKAQSIHVLLASCANQLRMSDNERKQYTNDIGKNLQQFYSILEEQSNVITCFKKENIPSVILKGAAAAINYPHPEYRCMGDVDVLVRKEDFERAFHVLCNAGYEPQQTLDFYNRHM